MYVALSLSTGLPLVTADERLVRMLSGSGCELVPLGAIAPT
jgi:predicted nucleic acid-binding protein